MLCFLRRHTIDALRKKIRSDVTKSGFKKLSHRDGQIGLVLILLAAIGLVFYAMTLNMNKVALAKNRTMIAAERSSAFMASFMASYAQQLSEEQLRGGLSYCAKTSMFKRLMIAIILVVIAIVSGGTVLGPALAVAAAFAVAAVVVDAVVIQPSITSAWNKMMQDSLSVGGQLIEYGVQYGLRTAVDDNVKFPDVIDMDRDGNFGQFTAAGDLVFPDRDGDGFEDPDFVSRFGYYYTIRLMGAVAQRLEMAPLDEFRKQLNDFLFYFDQEDKDGNNTIDAGEYDVWGLHDGPFETENLIGATTTKNPSGHVCDGASKPAECDDCCSPQPALCCPQKGCPAEVVCADPWPGFDSDDPDCCGSCSNPYVSPAGVAVDPHPSCDFEPTCTNATCEDRSYMSNNFNSTGAAVNLAGYPFVYDEYYEDTTNSIYSLREQIGKDDLSPIHEVNPANPSWHLDAGIDPSTHQRFSGSLTTAAAANNAINNQANRVADNYQAVDSSGFWSNDDQEGIFPFLYAVRDIGVSLSTASSDGYSGFKCYWRAGECLSGMGFYEDLRKNKARFYELLAPIAGYFPIVDGSPIILKEWGGAPSGSAGNEEVYLLGFRGHPDQVPDPAIFVNDDVCSNQFQTGWKRGLDSFCSHPPSTPNSSVEYPYFMECPKHGTTCQEPQFDDGYNIFPAEDRDCLCGEVGAWPDEFFPKDVLDDIHYGTSEFLSWSKDLISRLSSPASRFFMRSSVADWYLEAAEWLEPGCPDSCNQAAPPAPCCEVGDSTCCEDSFTKELRSGALYEWREELQFFYDQLNDWMYPLAANAYTGTGCTGAGVTFCMPTPQALPNEHDLFECPGITLEEQASFNAQQVAGEAGFGVRGDLEDVVSCLEWNARDEVEIFNDDGDQIYIVDGTGAAVAGPPAAVPPAGTHLPKGNQEKFQACATFCGPGTCIDLPRSVVDIAPYSALFPQVTNQYHTYWSDKELYTYCNTSKTYQQCDRRCKPVGAPTLDGLGFPGALPALPSPPPPPLYVAPDFTEIRRIEDQEYTWYQECAAGTFWVLPMTCNGFNHVINSCNVATHGFKFSDCIDSYGGSCEAFVGGTAPAAPYSGATDAFYSSVDLALPAADDSTGFCRDLNPIPLLNATVALHDWAQASADESENLVKKLEQRYRFLNYILDEGGRVRKIFGEAADRFSEFLDNNTPYATGPAANEVTLGAGYNFPNLERDVEWTGEGERVTISTGPSPITVYQNDVLGGDPDVIEGYNVDSPVELLTAMSHESFEREEGDASGDLPSVVVYVWRGDTLSPNEIRGDGVTGTCGVAMGGSCQRGYVHAVKVEVRAPRRCNSSCNPTGDAYQRWPWIRTKTSSWGMKRCYYLKDYVGLTKARVIRYDEPVDNSAREFRFANNVNIWGMVLSHPKAARGSEAGIFVDGSDCYQQIDPLIEQIGVLVAAAPINGDMYLHHAFMLNEVPDYDADLPYDRCWKQVHEQLLESGVHSESCAKYLWEDGDMGVRFVDCDKVDPDFKRGSS